MTEHPVKSSIEEIEWPAVPDPRASALLAILFQLERSQWWPAEKLEAAQFGQLQRLLAHARRSVPFYRERLKNAPTAPGSAFDLDSWREIPILRREDVQNAGDALISVDLPGSHGSTDEIFTSGSTGRAIRAVRTELWGLFWSAFTLRDHFWHRRDMNGKLATIRESGHGKAPYPDGAVSDNWGHASRLVFATGPSVSLNITSTVEQQVEWLRRENPDYLLTHPSIVHRLAEYCLEKGIQLPRLCQVETISEVLQPATRTLCQEVWGVPLVDMYTAREAGYIALQCPTAEHYHVQSEGIFVEVLNERGEPCKPGEIGRVIVTPLHNFAMPLIRYDIGDYAEAGEPCACGRGLPVLRRILGREQNMLIMPDGEARWPLLSSSDLQAMQARAPVRRYQFVQKSLESIELRLSTARPLTAKEQEALRDWVRDKFGHPFEVSLSFHDSLTGAEAGKFEDFISEIRR